MSRLQCSATSAACTISIFRSATQRPVHHCIARTSGPHWSINGCLCQPHRPFNKQLTCCPKARLAQHEIAENLRHSSAGLRLKFAMQLKIRVLFPLLSFGHCFVEAGAGGDQVKVGEINTSQKVAFLTPRSSSSSPSIPISVAKDGVVSECPHNGTTEVRCGSLLADCESSCRISNGSYGCGGVNLAVEAGRSLRAQNSWNDFQKVCSRLMSGSSAKQRAVAYDIFTWANHKYDAAKSAFAWTSFFYNHGFSARRGFDVVKRAYDLYPTFRSLVDVATTAESIYGTLQDVYSEVMVLFNTTVD